MGRNLVQALVLVVILLASVVIPVAVAKSPQMKAKHVLKKQGQLESSSES